MAIDDDNRGQFRRISHIKVRTSSRERRTKEVEGLAAEEGTEIALFESFERIGRVGIDFSRVID